MNPVKNPIVAALLMLTGCTTVLYQGKKLPDSEVVTIKSENVYVFSVDGQEVPYSGGNYAKFKILPGQHSIGVMLNHYGLEAEDTKNPVPVRLDAVAGKTYIVRPIYKGNLWRPEIVQENSESAAVSRGDKFENR